MSKKRKVYKVQILGLDIQDNAPEWANWTLGFDGWLGRFGFIYLTTTYNPYVQVEEFFDELKEELHSRLSYDIEREVEYEIIDIDYSIL